MGRSSPPPPPPPIPQPYKREKEESMRNRNEAFNAAIAAAQTAYTAAVTVKTLADILLPVSEKNLKEAIDEHLRIVSEFRKELIKYSASVNAFLHIDSVIETSIQKIEALKTVGEVNVDAFDLYAGSIQDSYANVQKLKSDIDSKLATGRSKVNEIKSILEKAYSSSQHYKAADAIIEKREVNKLSEEAQNLFQQAAAALASVESVLASNRNLETAQASKDSALAMTDTVIRLIGISTKNLTDKYGENIRDLESKRARAKDWYETYKRKADRVRNFEEILINGDVFRQLLQLSKVTHSNAIMAALTAWIANTYAYQDVHYVL
jgi:hypothetical protein